VDGSYTTGEGVGDPSDAEHRIIAVLRKTKCCEGKKRKNEVLVWSDSRTSGRSGAKKSGMATLPVSLE
jgi:hypothetical protein